MSTFANSEKVVLKAIIVSAVCGTISVASGPFIDRKNEQIRIYANTDNEYADNNYFLSTPEEKERYDMSIELTRNLNKLNSFNNLNLGEGIVFPQSFTNKIAAILCKLDKQPEVFPNFLGNIQLEFKDESNSSKYLEIEITPEMKMNIFKIDGDGNESEDENYVNFNIDKVKEEVSEFYE